MVKAMRDIIRLRLQPVGPRDLRRWSVVAIPNVKRRQALPLERLGMIDHEPNLRKVPGAVEDAGRFEERMEKRVEWNVERLNWWLERGAEPSNRVRWLLQTAGLLTPENRFYRAPPPGTYTPFSEHEPDFSRHWPESNPPSASNTPGVMLFNNKFVYPDTPRGQAASRSDAEYQAKKLANRALNLETAQQKADVKAARRAEYEALLAKQEEVWAAKIQQTETELQERKQQKAKERDEYEEYMIEKYGSAPIVLKQKDSWAESLKKQLESKEERRKAKEAALVRASWENFKSRRTDLD